MLHWLPVILLLMSSPLYAAKVYKWVDEDGNVSYRDKPPPEGSKGRVEEKQINPDINITTPTPVRKDKKRQQASGDGSAPEPGTAQERSSASEIGAIENDKTEPPDRGPEKKEPEAFRPGPEKRDAEQLKPGPGQQVQPGLKPGPGFRPPPPPPPSSGPGI